MKARHADSISATLSLVWLAIALGFVLALTQGNALPDRSGPVVEGRVSIGKPLEAASLQPVSQAVLEQEQKALAQFIAKRWRIAQEAATRFVSIAYRAGTVHSVDPLLILAVIAIESGFNPVAESVMGAKGLMQVIPQFHLEKLSGHGGEQAVLDPEVNIHVGAQILREYFRRLRDEQLALQMYAGAFDQPNSQYASKVYAERARLEPIRQRARKLTDQSV
jgi:soluble lytic murein transglycosylase-like protein